MKRLILLIALVIISISIAVPVMAFTPPTQDSTDNATDVILWWGDNVTITSANLTVTSANITIDNLEDDLTAAAEAGADIIAGAINDLVANIISLIIALAITGLAFWKNRLFYYIIGVPVDLTYGLSYAATNNVASAQWVMGIIIAVIGISLLFYAGVEAWKRRTKE